VEEAANRRLQARRCVIVIGRVEKNQDDKLKKYVQFKQSVVIKLEINWLYNLIDMFIKTDVSCYIVVTTIPV
jgi:hypothetical protein